MKYKIHYYVERTCDDCGVDIEECYFTNEKGHVVHDGMDTYGHYYFDGSASCEACHEASR